MPVRAEFPVLLMVTSTPELSDPTLVAGKLMADGLTVTVVPPTTTPVPDTGMVWGEPATLSATLSDAVRAPPAAGVNVTEIVHFAPAARVAPHVWVWLKSPGLFR